LRNQILTSMAGGFGANTNTNKAFGSTPFGSSTTGGGLFGGGASTGGGFGGFGASNNNNASSTPAFGASSNNAGGSLFGGAAKTGFGASANAGSGLFGGGGGSGFGNNNTNTNANTGGFGASGGGFGAAANQPNNGTATTPFTAFSEKDGATGNATQQYQTITFINPYQNYSLEELRVVDYNQGRRYGNQNGQAGAFGQSTGFGGFGNNNNTAAPTTSAFGSNNATTGGGGLFGGGANNNTTSAFGQNTGSAFGSTNNTASGGLFGANKPATGGLFGASTSTPAAGAGGGLFGGGASNTGTTGGFGSGGAFGASTNTGGGLFGNNQNQQKPAGGLFGSTTSAATGFGGAANTGNSFGQSNTGGGLFGQNNNAASSTPAFGANTGTTNTGGGLFGNTGGSFGQNNQNQAQTQPATGGLFGGGGFGQNNQQNQQKPGGLFGGAGTTANTGGGLFGQQNNTAQPSGGLFGGATNTNNASGGLFGQKPAATGGGLFGGSTNNNAGAASGGLFGNLGGQNSQQNTGGGLFGGQNNQQKPGGLFGNSTQNNNTGGSLFGGMGQNNNQQPNLGGSLFSSQNNQQQNQQSMSNSLFGASGSSLLNTSMSQNPYGNDSLFTGLATPTQNLGPLATPLSSSQKNKKPPILSQSKLNPSASLRLVTPQGKSTGRGYGFSYSTYGTPNSVSSNSSPGYGGSLFSGGGSLSRTLGKSMSTSNLRNSYNSETSILSPGAFSVTNRGYGGSLKKLNVNRSLNTRTPLFDEQPPKRVSFAGGEGGNTPNGATNGETALVVRQDEEDVPPRSVNGDAGNETPRPAMEQVNGSQLARVAEDSVLTPRSSSSVNVQPGQDLKPGNYWSQPALDQLKKMNAQQLSRVPHFVVGRDNVGQISFNEGKPVDLSSVNLDKLFGDIIVLNPRNATVYGDGCSCLPKPARGTALNQPSLITLGNSWPRNRAGKKDVKHLERLKRVQGTKFLKYNAISGEWTFTVDHFSSYGLDDDDYSDGDDEGSSELSPAPDTPAQSQLRSSQMDSTPQEESFASPTQSSPDDTFDFKKGMRGRASVPGGFGDEVAYEEDEAMDDNHGKSFLGQRSVGSLDGHRDGDYSDEGESGLGRDEDMAESASSPGQTTEHASAKDVEMFKGSLKPKSILKASQLLRPGAGTPSKLQAVFDDDWANQLQRTISPKKQDRQALRESQGHALREHEGTVTKLSQSTNGRNMTTAMDLMASLFGETEKEKFPKRMGHGIEV
jgi:nuclear pore complex protein Nup98-Nup96